MKISIGRKDIFLMWLFVFIGTLMFFASGVFAIGAAPTISSKSYGPDSKASGGTVSYADAISSWNIVADEPECDRVKLKVKQWYSGIDVLRGLIQDGPYSNAIGTDCVSKTTPELASIPYTPPKPGDTQSYDYRAMELNQPGDVNGAEGPWRGSKEFTVKNDLPVVTSIYPEQNQAINSNLKSHYISISASDPEGFSVQGAEIKVWDSNNNLVWQVKNMNNGNNNHFIFTNCLDFGEYSYSYRFLDWHKKDFTETSIEYWTDWSPRINYSLNQSAPNCTPKLRFVVVSPLTGNGTFVADDPRYTVLPQDTYGGSVEIPLDTPINITWTAPSKIIATTSYNSVPRGSEYQSLVFKRWTTRQNNFDYSINGDKLTITMMRSPQPNACGAINCSPTFEAEYDNPYKLRVLVKDGGTANPTDTFDKITRTRVFRTIEEFSNWSPANSNTTGWVTFSPLQSAETNQVTNISAWDRPEKLYIGLENPEYANNRSYYTDNTSDMSWYRSEHFYEVFSENNRCTTTSGILIGCVTLTEANPVADITFVIKKKSSFVPGSLNQTSLKLSKKSNVSSASKGQEILYQIDYTNIDSVGIDSVNTVITDTAPPNAFSSTYDFSQEPVMVEGKMTWNIGTVKPGETKSITYKAKIASDYSDPILKNNATVICSALSNPIQAENIVDILNVNHPPVVTLESPEDAGYLADGITPKIITAYTNGPGGVTHNVNIISKAIDPDGDNLTLNGIWQKDGETDAGGNEIWHRCVDDNPPIGSIIQQNCNLRYEDGSGLSAGVYWWTAQAVDEHWTSEDDNNGLAITPNVRRIIIKDIDPNVACIIVPSDPVDIVPALFDITLIAMNGAAGPFSFDFNNEGNTKATFNPTIINAPSPKATYTYTEPGQYNVWFKAGPLDPKPCDKAIIVTDRYKIEGGEVAP